MGGGWGRQSDSEIETLPCIAVLPPTYNYSLYSLVELLSLVITYNQHIHFRRDSLKLKKAGEDIFRPPFQVSRVERLHSSLLSFTFLDHAALTTTNASLPPLHHPLKHPHDNCKTQCPQGIARGPIPLSFREKLYRDCLRLEWSIVLHKWSNVFNKLSRASRVCRWLGRCCTTRKRQWTMAVLYHDLRPESAHYCHLNLQHLLRCWECNSRCTSNIGNVL